MGRADIVGRGIPIALLTPLVLYSFSPFWSAVSVVPCGIALVVLLRQAWRLVKPTK